MKNQATRRQARTAVPDASRNATPLLAQVLQAARRRCDDMQDCTAARDQMERDVLDTPPELLADLLTALSTVRITRADLISPTTTERSAHP
ncbi:hypothetical protein B2J88_11845 [Rhodococcus sp. SRB_17]|uniref:hypothetical protein n=1 Tax=Acidovorax sp. SRB_24 TaxID=1962700 RepID=UPI00145D2764|nr:hypothetical protein [Acidovorax sp. SRB_24]NMM75534.1 hypothetical protein [Acidovorax sp. SRB_24]NMM85053.1 hypothetical protein [Rhodococcus sp. SRB_17]